MKLIVRKLFINFEKEEKWLNQMAAKGLFLIDYSFGRYVFDKGLPGEYSYRIELLDQLPSSVESRAYLEFMESAGVECVATYFRWVYFRKSSKEGPFDLYSDYDSKIKHYKKVATFTAIAGFLNLFVALSNTHVALGSIGEGNGVVLLALTSLNWLIVVLLAPMIYSFIRTIRHLKREKQLYE
ncbi:hypothetical protein BHU72_05530 [Desulfuribacillus stibiiarsenatis]|uniref:DUF2812 domain-containing protein n=1 Tax=Desulfuribacillus stibiiarsenatis TaxID=1390249 RepID=A0A1E5L4K3_9FIRM|nr:DUF2812 domain-containing protein [Desulfuribacillus stibiiarsenatis]OEH85072.1 hypothetical protein BHU72_05530 [Desulfuribacillus stibiiarsenatis]